MKRLLRSTSQYEPRAQRSVPPKRWTNARVSTLVSAILLCMLPGCGGGGGGGGGDNVPPTTPVSAEDQCSAFLGRKFAEATVTKAMFVPTTGKIPEHCVTLGEMSKDLDFEVRMPTDWVRRTVFIGGGGFDGQIASPLLNPSASPDLAERRYATIASNHGHNVADFKDASWALDEQMFNDYANQSVPRVLAAAKQILRARYGDDIEKTKIVYEGCSGGGRQALLQAQLNPDLFDGIIARAPANAYNP